MTGGEPRALRAFACLEGNEALILDELVARLPHATVHQRRPGFLVVEDPGPDPRIAIVDPIEPAFARAELTLWGTVHDRRAAQAAEHLATAIADGLDDRATPPSLHVWFQAAKERDARSAEARALDHALRRSLGGRVRSKIEAAVGAEVIDVVCLGPGLFAFGAHRRTARMSGFPGGIRRLAARPKIPARSHLKIEEGLEWSSLPIARGDVAMDVGCAPGGWSSVLLERGLEVHGIDPAPVAAEVRAHERFHHHRVPVRLFAPEHPPRLPWVFCDMNGPPLDALGQIEQLLRRFRDARALFHTIKLSDDPPLRVAAEVERRVRALGFPDVLVRHLYHNRRELTLLARR